MPGKIPDLIGFLKAGQSIAQVSDAGLPSISDPGHDLVKAAIEEEIRSCHSSGCLCRDFSLDCQWFSAAAPYLYGFLPRKSGQQKQFFDSKKTILKLRFSMNHPIVWQIRWKIC